MFNVIMITYPLGEKFRWAGPFKEQDHAEEVLFQLRTNRTSAKVDFEIESNERPAN